MPSKKYVVITTNCTESDNPKPYDYQRTKKLQLSKRSLHTSSKTIRGRLLSYFSQLISEQGSNKIVSPFDRQQLADYLNLDRSALSKELGKMKRDGMIEYRKNCFEIKIDV